MRMIKIPLLSYEEYERIRNILYDEIPFALINQQYIAKTHTAYFYFWDSDYIPDALKSRIVQPPRSREDKDRLHKRLFGAMMKPNDKIKVVSGKVVYYDGADHMDLEYSFDLIGDKLTNVLSKFEGKKVRIIVEEIEDV